MAFGIKQIKSILSDNGIPLENLDKCAEELCGRHKTDIDSIKEERDSYKEQADTLEKVQKELDEIKAGDYKSKYETVKADYEKLKNDNSAKELRAKKEKAFSEWLKKEGYTEKGSAKIAKYGGFIDTISLDKDGNIEELEKLSKAVSDEWSEYKGQKVVEGTNNPKPPEGGTGETPKPSRAAELAAKYHANHYGGETKTENAKGE